VPAETPATRLVTEGVAAPVESAALRAATLRVARSGPAEADELPEVLPARLTLPPAATVSFHSTAPISTFASVEEVIP
jgi:hypothetical protein